MCCSDFPEMYPLDQVTVGMIQAGFPDESPAQAFDDHRFFGALEQWASSDMTGLVGK